MYCLWEISSSRKWANGDGVTEGCAVYDVLTIKEQMNYGESYCLSMAIAGADPAYYDNGGLYINYDDASLQTSANNELWKSLLG